MPDLYMSQPTPLPDVALDPQRQQAARVYASDRRRLMVVNLVVSALLVVGFLVSGASRWLKTLLLALGLVSDWALVPVYVAVVFVAFALLTEPLSWWSGHVLPHRYGLSTRTLRGWLADEVKMLALGLAMTLPVAEIVYWLLRSQPGTWWLWATAVVIIFGVVLEHVAPVLILPLFYKLTPLDDPVLVARVQNLAAQTRTRIVGVYTINLSSRTRGANALVIGLGSTKRIALGDTLYADYTPDEIETIIAHELAHQVHRDLELGVAVHSLLFLGGMYLTHLFLRWGVARFGFAGVGDVAALPLAVLAAGLFFLVTLPLVNAYSRWRETMADSFAVQATGKPRAFANAMMRLANQNLAEFDPPRWVVWLLYTHPPIRQRIERRS